MSSKTGLGGGNGDSKLKSERSSRSSGGLDVSWFMISWGMELLHCIAASLAYNQEIK